MDTRIPEPPALNDWRKFELEFALPLLVNITQSIDRIPFSLQDSLSSITTVFWLTHAMR